MDSKKIRSTDDFRIYLDLSNYICLCSEEFIVKGLVFSYAEKMDLSLTEAVNDLVKAKIIKKEDEQ